MGRPPGAVSSPPAQNLAALQTVLTIQHLPGRALAAVGCVCCVCCPGAWGRPGSHVVCAGAWPLHTLHTRTRSALCGECSVVQRCIRMLAGCAGHTGRCWWQLHHIMTVGAHCFMGGGRCAAVAQLQCANQALEKGHGPRYGLCMRSPHGQAHGGCCIRMTGMVRVRNPTSLFLPK